MQFGRKKTEMLEINHEQSWTSRTRAGALVRDFDDYLWTMRDESLEFVSSHVLQYCAKSAVRNVSLDVGREVGYPTYPLLYLLAARAG